MAGLTSARVQSNEVVKAEDFSYGFDSQIDNISRMLQSLLDPERDFVINGEVVSYVGGGMNISVHPVLGVSASTGISFIETEHTGPIGITGGWDVDRIDIIEVCGELTDTTLEQRAFIDFDTKQKTLQNVYTKKEVKLNVRVKHNENDGQYHATAPETSDGWVKLCEIFVPANAVDIEECTIYNITSDIADGENEGWTNEVSRTYNINYIASRNESFRKEHNQDGTHKSSVIHQSNIDLGTGQNQLSGNAIPTGGADIFLNGENIGNSTSLRNIISTIASKVTDLFNDYLKIGAFKFNGELCLSEILDNNNLLTNAIKIGAAGDGTAYCKIGENTIFTITENGTIRVAEGYSATNTYDLVTKSVTDALVKTINGIFPINGAVILTGDDINLSSESEEKLSSRSSVTLNGESMAGKDASFYAPTTVGTEGQFLQSNGSGKPVWGNLPTGKSINWSNNLLSYSYNWSNSSTSVYYHDYSWTATQDCFINVYTYYSYTSQYGSYSYYGYVKINDRDVFPPASSLLARSSSSPSSARGVFFQAAVKKGDVIKIQTSQECIVLYAWGYA